MYSITVVGIVFKGKDHSVGDSKTIHVSKSRPFWNKYLFIGMVWFTVTQAKTTLVEHIPTTINEGPTAPPSFLDEGQKALHVWLMDLLN